MLASLRNNDKYADLEIHCKGKIFKVHKAIVCGQVDFFAACESHTGVVELTEENPAIVGYFIDFLYTDKYEPNEELTTDKFANLGAEEAAILSQSGSKLGAQESAMDPSSSDLLVHSHVYVMADKYMVEPLKILAKKNFNNALSKLGEKDLHIFTSVLENVFEGSPESDRALKDPCVSFACTWYGSLRDRGEFRSFCETNGDVCLYIMDNLHDLVRRPTKVTAQQWKCWICGLILPLPFCARCHREL
ncbi:hypothetical protein HYFRA_00006810 [Hymenoscyphus fraxineus]|uniref:BTB domain-containing protein n=1 Tax=Hymenoscyphus fraxineus TaxID=746836 RepID=A0A9N9PQC6_9HELO|nr:hypothetical protein HYFRA_00006810 [Hymenoscyphus fraxineus]